MKPMMCSMKSGAGLWTNDLKRTHRMVAGLEAGAVWVNSSRKIYWAVSFGGFKQSGYGRDSWLENLRGYMQTLGGLLHP
jgi:acyl-CoA reductase-like NAD-dependent aldehyde dehydrogenase